MGYMVLRILGLTINCPPVLLFVVDRILIVLHYSVPGTNPIVANRVTQGNFTLTFSRNRA